MRSNPQVIVADYLAFRFELGTNLSAISGRGLRKEKDG